MEDEHSWADSKLRHERSRDKLWKHFNNFQQSEFFSFLVVFSIFKLAHSASSIFSELYLATAREEYIVS